MKKISNIDLARIAAFIDGEGYVGVSKMRDNRYPSPRHTLIVSVANTDMRLMDYLSQFSGAVHPLVKPPKEKNWKQAYLWKNEQREAVMLLKLVSEYLLLKKKQAELGIEFYEICFGEYEHMGGLLSSAILNRRESYYNRLKELNKRGRKQNGNEEPARLLGKKHIEEGI